jgi:hypothetical protein
LLPTLQKKIDDGKKEVEQIMLVVFTIKWTNSIGTMTWFTSKLKQLRKGLPVNSFRFFRVLDEKISLKNHPLKNLYNIINILLDYVIVYRRLWKLAWHLPHRNNRRE